MRILMLAQFYSPIIGEAEYHVLNLSRELVAQEHVVSVATLWQGGADEPLLSQLLKEVLYS